MKVKNQMNRKKINNILYICILLLNIVSILKIINKRNAPKKITEVSATDIQDGKYSIFDDNIVLSGNVTIESNEEGILLSLEGNEINGKNIRNKDFQLKPIKFDKIQMTPVTTFFETYYIYKSEDEYVLLLKGKEDDYFTIKNNREKVKNKNLYLISVLDKRLYNSIVNYANEVEIFTACAVRNNENRYTCYFFQ